MSGINSALNLAASPNYSIDQILQTTKPLQAGGFRRVLGAVVGGAGNIFAPGIGGIIGSAIGGGATTPGGVFSEAMGYLRLQQQLTNEQQVFEAASAVVKSRHDAAMAAIRNIN